MMNAKAGVRVTLSRAGKADDALSRFTVETISSLPDVGTKGQEADDF
jgi:hypothetical protein